jgi:hypothetical protein
MWPQSPHTIVKKTIKLGHLHSSLTLLQSKLVCLSMVRKYLYIEQGASLRVEHLAGANLTDNCKSVGENPITLSHFYSSPTVQQSKLVCLSIVIKYLQVVQGASLRLEHLASTKPTYNYKVVGEKPYSLPTVPQSKLGCLSNVRKYLQVVQGVYLRVDYHVGIIPTYYCEKPIKLGHLHSSLTLLQSKLVCLSIVRIYLYIEQGSSRRVEHLAGANLTDNCKSAGDNPIKLYSSP